MRTQKIEFTEDDVAILMVISPAINKSEDRNDFDKVMLIVRMVDFAKYEADPTKIDYVSIVNDTLFISSKYKGGELVCMMMKETLEMKRDRVHQIEERKWRQSRREP